MKTIRCVAALVTLAIAVLAVCAPAALAVPDVWPPVTSAALSPAANAAGWCATQPVAVTLSANDDAGIIHSGVASTEYRVAGDTSWTPYTAPFAVTVAGSSTYEFRSIDVAGNPELPKTVTVKIDTAAPVTGAALTPAANAAGWCAAPSASVTLSATDDLSGVVSTEYRVAGDTTWTLYTAPFAVTSAGSSTYEFRSTDVAGNVESAQTVTVKVDGAAPVTGAALTPAANAAGWCAVPSASVTLSATDELSGVASTEYRLAGDTTWTPYTAPFAVTSAGSSTYEFRSTDVAGNVESAQTVTVKVDGAAPVTIVAGLNANAAGWCKAPATVTLSGSDTLSGLGSTEYRLAGSATWSPYAAPFVVSREGSSTYEYRSVDVAGNAEMPQTVTVNLDTRKPVTTAYAVTATKGNSVKVPFKVSDSTPGCREAIVILKVYKGRALKKTIKVPGTCACNMKKTCSWRCTLAKGSYTIKVYAQDIAGNAQRKVGSATLTVR